MKKLLFLFLSMCLTCSLLAQGTITGIISDAETGEPLVGVNILLDRDISGTTTNNKGEFEFKNLEQGELKIIASYVGYGKIIKNVFVGKNNISLEIEMFRAVVEADEVVVTATRSEQTISNIPGRIELISPRRVKASSAQSIDELFKGTAGVNVDRTTGIFDRPVIAIRGITGAEQGRVLALIDGVPINKTDGGTINWNRININDIEKVEIYKGPGSSIYGNNAMGGVINMITKRKKNTGLSGNASFGYSDFKTHKESGYFSGLLDSGFYFNLSAANRKSDGYIETKEAWRDSTTVNAFMEELMLSGKVGMNLSENSFAEIEYNHYDDKRGRGIKIKAPEGAYSTHKTNFVKAKYKTNMVAFNIDINAYYQLENYLKIDERLKFDKKTKKDVYTRFDVDADRTDMGVLVNVNYPMGEHNITIGGEIKIGKIKGADVYKTSPDVVENKGDMNSGAFFIQDEWQFNEKLRIIAGLRFDQVLFTNGEFNVKAVGNESPVGFMKKFEGKLKEYDWKSVTPKFALQYKVNNHISMYTSYSQGFRAATLDDLTRSGFIRGSFKQANPELDPETVNNIELGMNFDFAKRLFILPSFYFMIGNNFLYYLDTGETIFGGKKKVLKKANITKVNIVGADLDVKFFISPKLSLFANYTFTKSEIKEFKNNTKLEGKELTYTPKHMSNMGFSWLNKYINWSVSVNYKSEQFTTDDNSEKTFDKDTKKEYGSLVESHVTVDLKLWKKLFKYVNLSLNVQNIFDNKFQKHYDRISLGRFITGKISLSF